MIMKKIALSLSLCFGIIVSAQAQSNTNFYLHNNGVTIKCSNAAIGETGVVNGVEYTKRTRDQITPENASTTCTSGITDTSWLFFNLFVDFDVDISTWDVSSVTDMTGMFSGASFNGDISKWDVSSVTDMTQMFSGVSFNQNISDWDVSNVENMSGLFEAAWLFNQNISDWDVSNVTQMDGMFTGANSFNQNIGNWDVSSVTNMAHMFDDAVSFNQNLNDWNVSNVTHMGGMFSWATNFNGDISEWDVSNVSLFHEMFKYATAFNRDISSWDLSSATVTSSMFAYTNDFNQDIGTWNVSNVTFMNSMFKFAESFNQNIGYWDVSDVTYMTYMFFHAESFNQDLSNWCVLNIPTEPYPFATNSPLTEENKPIWGTCPDQDPDPEPEDYRLRLIVEQIGGHVPIDKVVLNWRHRRTSTIRYVEVSLSDSEAIVPQTSFTYPWGGENAVSDQVNLEKIELIDSSGDLVGKIYSDLRFNDIVFSDYQADLILYVHNNVNTGWTPDSGWKYFYSQDEVPVTMLVPPNGQLSSVDTSKEPLLFVHGIWGKYPYWDEEISSSEWLQLSNAGYDVWQFYYPYDMSIPKIGDMLGEALDVLTNTPASGFSPGYNVPKIPIVAHSMGGLVTRSHIQSNSYNNRINKLLMLGTPNHGSIGAWRFRNTGTGAFFNWISSRDRYSPANRQLIPGSEFLKELNNQIPKVLQNSLNTDYMVFAGINSSNVLLQEILNQDDNVVSVSSATLRNFDIPLFVFNQDHTEIRNPGVSNIIKFLSNSGVYSGFEGFWINENDYSFSNIPNNSKGMLKFNIPGLSTFVERFSLLTLESELEGIYKIRAGKSENVTEYNLVLDEDEFLGGGTYFLANRGMNQIGFSFSPNVTQIEFGRYDCRRNTLCLIRDWKPIVTFDVEPDSFFSPINVNNWSFPISGPDIMLLLGETESQQATIFTQNLSNIQDQPQTTWFLDAAVDSVAFYMSVPPDLPETDTYNMSLETPSGTTLTPADAASNDDLIIVENTTKGFAYFFVRNPEPGLWGMYHNQPVEEVYVSAPIGTDVNFRIDRPDQSAYTGYEYDIELLATADPEFSIDLTGNVYYRHNGEPETFLAELEIEPSEESNKFETSFIPENEGTYRFEFTMTVMGEELSVSRVQQFEAAVVNLLELATPENLLPVDGSDDHTNFVSLSWSEVSEADGYEIELYKAAENTALMGEFGNDWDLLVQGAIEINEVDINNLILGNDYSWRVRAIGEDAASEWSEPSFFSNVSDQYTLFMAEGWQLVGLPLEVLDNAVGSVFPESVGNTLFKFDNQYVSVDELEPGRGYWLRYDEPMSEAVVGNYNNTIEIDLNEGWNLFAPGSFLGIVDQIQDLENIIVPESIFGFGNVYYLADVLYPGSGYWVKALADGVITINETSETGETNLLHNRQPISYQKPEGYSIIRLKSGDLDLPELYFSGAETQAEREYVLPPKPPAGIADARFTNGSRKIAATEALLEIQQDPEKAMAFQIETDVLKNYVIIEYASGQVIAQNVLLADKSFEVSRQTDNILLRLNDDDSGLELPKTFSLGQNYPNPFNPVTNIQYELPVDSNVLLEVFDILGRRVAVLVNGPVEAGRYTATFDASRLASGMYIYRLRADNFIETRKMMLVK